MIEYTIAELAEKSGISRRNIYFYIQQGLVPPAEGAGLAARYQPVHLARLRAIPLLRQDGLRLHDIRRFLTQTSAEELEQWLHQRVQRQKKPIPAAVLKARTCLSYDLAPGVVLYVDATCNSHDRKRLQLLLEQAQRLFTST